MTMLKIELPDGQAVEMNQADFSGISSEYQVPEVHLMDARFRGQGVYFSHVLKLWGLDEFAGKVKLTAAADRYEIVLELELIKKTAILIYALDGEPIPKERGGPLRLMVPGTQICKSNDVINNCANVKHLDGMTFINGAN